MDQIDDMSLSAQYTNEMHKGSMKLYRYEHGPTIEYVCWLEKKLKNSNKELKMREYLELGSSPTEEDCIQVQSNTDYKNEMCEECSRYKDLLKKIFSDIPDSCTFSIKSFPHDFGNYYEVVVYYNPDIEASVEYAFNVESNLPAHW
jgi:hypothetical protein